MPYGNRKAVKKSVRWTLFRPWEIPLASGRIPKGMWTEGGLDIVFAVLPNEKPYTTVKSREAFLTAKNDPAPMQLWHEKATA